MSMTLQKQGLEISKRIRGPHSIVLGCSLISLGDSMIEYGKELNQGLKLLTQGYKILKEYPSMIEFAERTLVAGRIKISIKARDYGRCVTDLKRDLILAKTVNEEAALNRLTLESIEQMNDKLKLEF